MLVVAPATLRDRRISRLHCIEKERETRREKTWISGRRREAVAKRGLGNCAKRFYHDHFTVLRVLAYHRDPPDFPFWRALITLMTRSAAVPHMMSLTIAGGHSVLGAAAALAAWYPACSWWWWSRCAVAMRLFLASCPCGRGTDMTTQVAAASTFVQI